MTQANTPNKTNLRLWVAALRSGEFKQVHGRLKVINLRNGSSQYCCLGAACEVALTHGVELETQERHYGDQWACVSFDGERTGLPRKVSNWLGVEWLDPIISKFGIPGYTRPTRATIANDAFHWSFNKIADAIEEFYELKEEHDDPR